MDKPYRVGSAFLRQGERKWQTDALQVRELPPKVSQKGHQASVIDRDKQDDAQGVENC